MINLLPPDVKSHYHYGQRNVVLLRWVFAMAFGVLGLIIIGAGGALYMYQTSRDYDKQITAETAALEARDLSATQSQVKSISTSLKLAVQVLSKEILFSKLLEQLGTLTPANVTLSNLIISDTDKAVDITAQATDYQSATQLQVNLSADGNKLFQKADIVSITCNKTSDSGTGSKYPCAVTIRALFTANNPYLFINDGKV